MSKKTLLNEATVRRFMKLAEIEPLTSGFVNENYPPMADDDEAAEDAVPEDATPAEADWDEAEFEAGEEEAEEEMGDDLDVDLDMEDADPGELTLTDEEAEVFLKVADKVRAAMEAGGDIEDIPAPDMGGDEEIDVVDLDMEAPEMGDEDLDVEEEEVDLQEKQGYDDREDESLGMRTGKESGKKQSEKARREDSYGKWGKRGKEDRHVKEEKQGYDDREDESLGMRTGKESGKKQSEKARREDSYGKWGKRGKEDRHVKEEKQGYDDREDESLGMRTGKESGKKQSEKARREDSYGKWGKRGKEDRHVNEDLVNEIAARIAKRVLQAKKK